MAGEFDKNRGVSGVSFLGKLGKKHEIPVGLALRLGENVLGQLR